MCLVFLDTRKVRPAGSVHSRPFRSVLSIHHNRSLERALADITFGKYLSATGDVSRAREIWEHSRSILLELEGERGLRQAEVYALIHSPEIGRASCREGVEW